MRILTGSHYYRPGYKAGGPIRTITNLVGHLGQEFDFSILTSDRDVGDRYSYSGIEPSDWKRLGQANVFYVEPGFRRLGRLAGLFGRTPCDVLYLNSLFDYNFTLLPLLLMRLGLSPATHVVLAPRGELSPGALSLKKTKKTLFLSVARLFRLYRGVTWQASSDYEAADIRTWMGAEARVMIAPNLPSAMPPFLDLAAQRRQPGQPLRLVFLSRIAPKKNLDLVLRLLQAVQAPLDLSIVGPEEDPVYVAQCKRLAAALPGHVKVQWCGAVPPEEVPAILARQDLFFFPTRGENYGHVIAEALSVGTPVLLADTTPWRDLEASGVGWDLPLDDEAAFVARIEHCARLSPADYAAWRERVRDYARARLDVDAIVEANRRLFFSAAGRLPSTVGDHA